MVARVVTVAFDGVEARRVDVEVQQVANPPGAFAIVGLPDKAVAESRERVRGAFAGIGLALPPKKVIANLAPADLPKEGSHFDLPIALALLASMGVIGPDALDGWAAVGELGLDGQIASVGGTLPAAMAVGAMGLGLICPEANGAEAAWAGQTAILAPRSLISLINHFKGSQILRAPDPGPVQTAAAGPDLREVKGQESAKRALETPPVTAADMALPPPAEGTPEVAARVLAAREQHAARLAELDLSPDQQQAQGVNARLHGAALDRVATPDDAGRALLMKAGEAGGLTARGWTRTLRLARTIADLDGSTGVLRRHVAEALMYRRLTLGAETQFKTQAQARQPAGGF